VLVDDGSRDDPLASVHDLIEADPRIRFYSGPNRGVACARNLGYSKLEPSCRYVMFLDGDDELDPDALQTLVDVLEKDPMAGMVHCKPCFIDDVGKTIEGREWIPRWAFGPRRLTDADLITPFESVYLLAGIIPSLTLFRRSVVDQVGGYDELFGQLYEDTDFNLQIAIRSKVAYCARPVVRYRIRPGQSTANVGRHATQQQKLFAKWRVLATVTTEQREIVDRAEAFRTGDFAAHQGALAARRYFSRGEYLYAARFLLGSFRIRLMTFLKRFSR